MHVNHRYILERCRSLITISSGKILDYGCGAGDIVEAGRKHGLDIYGVEAFYEGGNTREAVREKGLLGHTIKELDNDHIPFPDNNFDLVVSNQVFEHISIMHTVLKEIERVLKPGGKLFCLFPSKDVLREGHCGIPMVHWFSKGSRYRYYWMLLFRKLGLGRHKYNMSPEQWSTDFLEWLDRFTFYRSYREINNAFLKHFSSLRHIEEDYIAYRLSDHNLRLFSKFARLTPFNYLSRWVYRKFGGMVIVAIKINNALNSDA